MRQPRTLVAAHPARTDVPRVFADGRAMEAFHAEVAARVRPTRRRLNIMSALATGHLPWGVAWPYGLTRLGNRWILCCGHTLTFAQAQSFVAAGLLAEAKNFRNEDCLAITRAGKSWLQAHWPS